MSGQVKSRVVNLVDHNLSNKELHVLQLIADKRTVDEISDEIDMSSFTVQALLSSIVTKLDANSVSHAVAVAIRKNYIR